MSEKITENEIKDALHLLIQASNEQELEFAQFISLIYGRLKDAEGQGFNKVKEIASAINEDAHEKPWIYVAAAVLSGFVVGLFCRKRQ